MEEHVKALMTIVAEQGKTITEMKERLTHLTHSASVKPEHIDTTPVSGPPLSVQDDYTDGRKKPNQWRSSTRIKKPPFKDIADPDYTPPIYVSDRSDHDTFYRRGKKKRSTAQAAKTRRSTCIKVNFP